MWQLCARGFKEIWGLHYTETHASVTTLTAWRACLAEAAKHNLKVAVFDIRSAYLMATLEEDVYMKPFPGLELPYPGAILKLKKALYGCRQAGRAWAKRLTAKLKSMGFTQSQNDPCFFYVSSPDGKSILRLNI